MTNRSPSDRFLVHIGALGPLGRCPASGTVTVAVVGIPLFWLTRSVPLWLYLVFLAAFLLASVWLHQRGDAILGEKDSRVLVWDEVAGFMVAVIGLPFTWQTALVAFLLERVLDICKFPPGKWVEDRWPGGWGVVGDDVVAGLYTLLIMHVLVRAAPGLML